MAERKGPNKCGCDRNTCAKSGDKLCYDYKCTQCRACCDAECEGCEEKCTGVEKREDCKCRIPFCGCQTNCYRDGKNGNCEGQNSCERCKVKCKDSDKCICYQCICGPRCNGVICSCCSWCDPTNCSGGKCNGYVIGRCRDKGLNQCEGHVKYHNGNPVFNRRKLETECNRTHGANCTNNCDKWAIVERDENNNCVIKCTYCGTLCSQDWCRIWLGVLIIGLIILSCFIVMWGMFPETFHRLTTGIRAAFPISSRRPDIPPSNLVTFSVPVETNIDRYSALRPRTYAGLA